MCKLRKKTIASIFLVHLCYYYRSFTFRTDKKITYLKAQKFVQLQNEFKINHWFKNT